MKISFSTHGLEYMNVWRSFITNKYFYAIISILKPKKDWYHIFLFLDLAVVDVPFFLSTYFLIKIPVCYIFYFVMEGTLHTCLAFIYIFTFIMLDLPVSKNSMKIYSQKCKKLF